MSARRRGEQEARRRGAAGAAAGAALWLLAAQASAPAAGAEAAEVERELASCEALLRQGRGCEAWEACLRADARCPDAAWRREAPLRRRALRACRRACPASPCPGEGWRCEGGRCVAGEDAEQRVLAILLEASAPPQAPCAQAQRLRGALRRAWDAGLDARLPLIEAHLDAAREGCARLRSAEAGARWQGRDGASMVLVPAGPFARGADEEDVRGGMEVCAATYASPPDCNPGWFARERPRRVITLAAFYIDEVEVTNARYNACVAAGACRAPDRAACQIYDPAAGAWRRGAPPGPYLAAPDHPVVCVTWEEAEGYCRWAGKRLPTEAEWEKAARGADGRPFPWGQGWDARRLNWGEPAGYGQEDGFAASAPVGSFPLGRSPYGTLDMAGNVWEWTWDWMAEDYYAQSPTFNPRNATAATFRVLRGGSWRFAGNGARTTYRYFDRPTAREDAVGFRCVLSNQ